MAKSDSGRVVIEVDPSLKRRLHSALAMEGVSLKQWFIDVAEKYLTPPTVASKKPSSSVKKP
jgi:predicted HicB family RNase H-like nuclease